MRPATHHEIRQLRERYVMPLARLKPDARVQILAFGRVPYAARVIDVRTKLAEVEFQKRTGATLYRDLHFDEIFVDGALEKLRSERPCVGVGDGCGKP